MTDQIKTVLRYAITTSSATSYKRNDNLIDLQLMGHTLRLCQPVEPRLPLQEITEATTNQPSPT